MLSVEQPVGTFTIIPPIRRTPRDGLLAREVPIPSQVSQPTPPADAQNQGGVGQVVGFTPAPAISWRESMGMGGRHHHLPVPDQQPGGVEEEVPGGAQEADEESITATESGAASTTTTQVPDAGRVEAREEEGELPSSGSQEAMLPPGLTIVYSSPMSHVLVSLSLEAISIHSSTQSSHPSAGLTLPPPAQEALAMAHLERTLGLVRSAITKATPSSSYTTQATQPPAEAAHTMNNEWYWAINNDGWYKYKPDQHISRVKLCWENPDMPDYTAYLKPEMQAGNPMLVTADTANP
jgi:hypothetical protein